MGRYTMRLTAKQAAEATGKSKPTILRAITNGKVSAVRDEVTGAWMIDPAELHRVFPPKSGDLERSESVTRYDATTEAAVLRRELEILTAEREREREQFEAQLADLRRVMALLTDQRPIITPPPATAAAPDVISTPPPATAPKARRWWFGKRQSA